MAKRSNGGFVAATESVDVTAVLRGEEPEYRPVSIPPQVMAAVVGLAGFMGCQTRVVAFEQETATGRKVLTIAIDPRVNAKDKKPFVDAIAAGPVTFSKQDKVGRFSHLSGDSAFYSACDRCEKISHTLTVVAQHADQIRFVSESVDKPKSTERAPKRTTQRQKQRNR